LIAVDGKFDLCPHRVDVDVGPETPLLDPRQDVTPDHVVRVRAHRSVYS